MNRRHIALILDKSSSMASTKVHTISGFNEQVAQIKLNDQNSGYETTVTLVTFNGEVFEHLLMAPASELEEADPTYYIPNGSTAFRDALGYTITKIREKAHSEDDVLITSISDGEENASTHYTPEAIKEMVEGLQSTGKWTFSYMGCGSNSLFAVHKETGIPIANMASWSNVCGGDAVKGLVGTANAMGKYLRSKNADPNLNLADNFYSAEVGVHMDFCDADTDNSSQNMSVARSLGLASKSIGQNNNAEDVINLRVGKSDIFAKGNKVNY